MATFYRADGWVKSVQGQAIAGAQIYICTQPADFSFLPPIPLASVFADSLGLTPIVQPLITDGFGHFDYYAASGTPYTEVVVNNGKVQANYQDQVPMGATLGTPVSSVSSVFGRLGDVVAAANDYSFSQISGQLALGQIPAGGSPTTFLRGDGVWGTPAGAGTVTNTGALTLNAIILGNAGVDIKAGVVLPGSASVFLDGTGAFSTPASGSGTVTNTAGPLTLNALVVGNGAADEKVLSSLGTTTTVLHGNASGLPTFGTVVEADITLANNVTNNVSTSAHGFAPILPNDATQFLDGTGNYSVPASSGITTQTSYLSSGRLINTVYQNLTGKVLYVSVAFNGSNPMGVQAISDASVTPTLVVANNNGPFAVGCFFIVLPNNYYEVVPGGSTSTAVWVEWN